MISDTRRETINKMLAKAGHRTTNPNEAVSALQLACKMLDRDGYTLSDLRFSEDFEPIEDSGAPPILDVMRKVDALEAENKARIRNETRLAQENEALTSENASLKAALKKLQSAPRLLPKGVTREAIMDIASTPTPNSTPEEVAQRREEKREERLAKVRAGRTARREPRKVKDGVKAPRAARGFQWADHPDQYKQMVNMYLAGTGKVAITKELGIENLNAAQVHAATANGRPPAFLNVQVHEEGPMSWPEAWLIGSALFAKKRSWLGPTLQALGITAPPAKGLSFHLAEHADEAKVAGLRARYRENFPDGKGAPAAMTPESADAQAEADMQADGESSETRDEQAA